MTDTRKGNGFRIGDVIHNGWAGKDNCYYLVVGRCQVGSTKCYRQHMFFKGKLLTHNSPMDIKAEKQTKIGHIDIPDQMQTIINQWESERRNNDD